MPEEFNIPTPQWPDEQKVIEVVTTGIKVMLAERKGCDESRQLIPANVLKAIADIATHVWKARSRMTDPNSGEVREDMKRVHGDLERIGRCLTDLGVVIEDQTNKAFDYGLPWKVVATKPMPGLSKEIVTETLRPTIKWNERIIQDAMVEIGTPAEQQQNL